MPWVNEVTIWASVWFMNSNDFYVRNAFYKIDRKANTIEVLSNKVARNDANLVEDANINLDFVKQELKDGDITAPLVYSDSAKRGDYLVYRYYVKAFIEV